MAGSLEKCDSVRAVVGRGPVSVWSRDPRGSRSTSLYSSNSYYTIELRARAHTHTHTSHVRGSSLGSNSFITSKLSLYLDKPESIYIVTAFVYLRLFIEYLF